MIVILAEKNSAANNFAKALGGKTGRYNGEDYDIVAASGHVYSYPNKVSELVPDDRKEKYDNWNIDNLPWDPDDFKWKLRADKSKLEVISKIKNALTTATEVCIATDNDPTGEGDLIAWEILLALGWKGKTTRMLFDDESVKSVRKAFENRVVIPGAEQHGPFVKARARSKFDYLSMQFTRIATLLARDRGHYATLRQGRLKSVMVYLTGKQLEDIRNYVKVPFYEVRFKDENGTVYKRKEDDAVRFPSEADVDISNYSDSAVVLDKKETRGIKPGKMLDLAGLSSILASKGYNPKDILDTYQKMYEDQVVSYPRTDDKKITPEQYEELKNNRFDIADVIGVNHKLLTHDTPWDDGKGFRHVQDSATHGANRPGENIPSSLDELKKYGASGPAIYELLAKSALSIFGEAYIYERQTGHLEDYPDFQGVSNIPKKMGFKEIFDVSDEIEEEGAGLGEMASPYIHEGANPKPKTPTMKWLVGPGGKLEKYNVGTGSTRTSTFDSISDEKEPDKQLIKMDKKGHLKMTENGEYSYILLKGCKIASPEVTEELKRSMDEVGEFRKNQDEIMHSITPIMIHDMAVMRDNAVNIPMGAPYIQKQKTVNIFKPTGEEVSFSTTWGGHEFTDEEIELLLEGEVIEIDLVSKEGKPYSVKGHLGKDKYQGRSYWGFIRDVDLPEVFLEHVFTAEERERLLSGEVVFIEKLWSQKRKKEFSSKIRYVNGKIEFVSEFPESFGGHTFTEEEKALLMGGKKIFVSGLWSDKKQKSYDAGLVYKDGRVQPIFSKKKN